MPRPATSGRGSIHSTRPVLYRHFPIYAAESRRRYVIFAVHVTRTPRTTCYKLTVRCGHPSSALVAYGALDMASLIGGLDVTDACRAATSQRSAVSPWTRFARILCLRRTDIHVIVMGLAWTRRGRTFCPCAVLRTEERQREQAAFC